MKASTIRKIAWGSLSGKWGIAVLVGFMAALLGGLSSLFFYFQGTPSFSVSVNAPTTSTPEATQPDSLLSAIPYETFVIIVVVVLVILTFAIISALISSIVNFILSSIIGTGYCKFNLDLVDGRPAKFSTLFSSFRYFGKALLTNFLRQLFVSLWSLLFIIPGIIADYRYGIVLHILADDPTISPMEAIRRSKALMKGNKWRLFCLCFSFIGWDMLCLLSCGILNLWITPYKHAALATFYRFLIPDVQNGSENVTEELDCKEGSDEESINAEGHGIDAEGHEINAEGHEIDAEGHEIDDNTDDSADVDSSEAAEATVGSEIKS